MPTFPRMAYFGRGEWYLAPDLLWGAGCSSDRGLGLGSNFVFGDAGSEFDEA